MKIDIKEFFEVRNSMIMMKFAFGVIFMRPPFSKWLPTKSSNYQWSPISMKIDISGVFWSEKLVGNDETCNHISEFWYGSRLGISVFAPKHNQTSLLLLFSFLSFRGTWTCPRQISGTTVQLCGKGGQSHILRGSKGMGVTIESYWKGAI